MPNCPSTPASIVSRFDVEYPDAARAEHLEGTALAKVSIDEHGHVVKVTIQRSAGSGILDQAAIKVANSSTYKPAIGDNCKPTPSIYVMVVDFKP